MPAAQERRPRETVSPRAPQTSHNGRTAVSISRSVAKSSTGGSRYRLDPVESARAGAQLASAENRRAVRAFDEQRLGSVDANRQPGRAFLNRAPENGRLKIQSPSMAAVEPSKCWSMIATPAQRACASIRSKP